MCFRELWRRRASARAKLRERSTPSGVDLLAM
jgi:hypothetical protein